MSSSVRARSLNESHFLRTVAVRLLAAIHPPDVAQAIRDCLALPSRAPPAAPAVPDPKQWPVGSEPSP